MGALHDGEVLLKRPGGGPYPSPRQVQAQQKPDDGRRRHRLFEAGHVGKTAGNDAGVVTGGEQERRPPFPQHVRYGEDPVSDQIDVEDGDVDRLAALDKALGVLDSAERSQNPSARLAECGGQIIGEIELVLDDQNRQAFQGILHAPPRATRGQA
ncbi:conserved hypothetical protein [Ricinus communis]|uniref:Uncharacterized protein n=1 Tax=Ricinus communis TaxID=3988 RepID=B9TCK6_RICCO|nr:conserved hypothetical protein [Ricinus communis]